MRLIKIFVLFIIFLSIPAFAQHSATLIWVQSSDPVALNCVARATTSGTENFNTPLFCSTTPIVTYKDLTVVAGTTYYYQVDAVSSGGIASQPSNEAKAVIPLSSPTNLQVTSN